MSPNLIDLWKRVLEKFTLPESPESEEKNDPVNPPMTPQQMQEKERTKNTDDKTRQLSNDVLEISKDPRKK